MAKDEYAYILEYLPYGLPDSRDRRPSAIILTESVALLIAALKKGVTVEVGKKVYIGEDKRDEIHHIMSRITPDKLSGSGLQRLEEKIDQMVIENEVKYVGIINSLGPINVRLNAIELIPGMGKKTTQKLLDERKKKPFESYKDLDERMQLSPSISKDISARIFEELQNKDKYRIFT